MGTVFSIDIRDHLTAAIESALRRGIALLHHIDAVFSTYRPHSPISRLGRGEIALADCPDEVADVLRMCEAARRASGGWFDHYAAGGLDPSGLVKGWSVEEVSRLLAEAGAANTCVNGGGDIRLRGCREPGTPWRIGISDPLAPGRLLTVVSGGDMAVATSGVAERGCHVRDPHTGAPADGLAAVTLTGPGLAETDAYATAAAAMGPDRVPGWLDGLDGYQAMTVTVDGRVWSSPGFPVACYG
jgi:thiamine biosynthesis lipoprotein